MSAIGSVVEIHKIVGVVAMLFVAILVSVISEMLGAAQDARNASLAKRRKRPQPIQRDASPKVKP